MNIFIRRLLSNDRAESVPCSMEILSARDIPEAVRMYESVVHGLGPDIFARITPEELAATISSEGIMVGVRYGNRLICLRSVLTKDTAISRFLDKSGLDARAYGDCAVTGFCVVDRNFRGNNVQFLSYYYIENLLSERFNSILTTVSPTNIFSLQNILDYGFSIIDLKQIYEGNLRYIMRKRYRPSTVVWMKNHLKIKLEDLDSQRKALSDGLSGYKLIWDEEHGFRLLFGSIRLSQKQQNSFL